MKTRFREQYAQKLMENPNETNKCRLETRQTLLLSQNAQKFNFNFDNVFRIRMSSTFILESASKQKNLDSN